MLVKKIVIIFMLISLMSGGCSVRNIDKTPEYQGGRLKIGIIGDIPKVRESQVRFEVIDFDTLKENNFDSEYDAVFITKENLSEASEPEYSSIYKTATIPFYFIENEKFDASFTEEELLYEDIPDSKDGMYITGLLYSKNKAWGYGLYNDTKSEANIKGVYSRVFEDIFEIKNNRLP